MIQVTLSIVCVLVLLTMLLRDPNPVTAVALVITLYFTIDTCRRIWKARRRKE